MRSKIAIIILFLALPAASLAGELSQDLAGRILLQVEANGEAWWVDPDTYYRHFLGRPADAWTIMREHGLGATDRDLSRIPVGLLSYSGSDADGDGLTDALETALGSDPRSSDSDKDGFGDREEVMNNYDPAGGPPRPIDPSFARRQAGRILLQVQGRGEAWYVNPVNNRRYFLGRPGDAFAVMRSFALGIKNEKLKEIVTTSPYFDLRRIEQAIHERVNGLRADNGMGILQWNSDLANVAREHSRNLAEENELFSGFGASCDFPLIHHIGLDFGLTNSERMKSRGVYYFSQSGENIALVSGVGITVLFAEDDPLLAETEACAARRDEWDREFKQQAAAAESAEEKKELAYAEINRRISAYNQGHDLEIAETDWHSEDEVASSTVKGWWLSPGHRENILLEEYTEAGVGTAYVNGYVISTQIYIERAQCGYETGACCAEPGYYPYCFIPLECEQGVCVGA